MSFPSRLLFDYNFNAFVVQLYQFYYGTVWIDTQKLPCYFTTKYANLLAACDWKYRDESSAELPCLQSRSDAVVGKRQNTRTVITEDERLTVAARTIGLVDGDWAQVKVSSTLMNNDSGSFAIAY